MSDMSNDLQELVRKQGDEVGLDTPHCVLWKSEHENCVDCECELGCGKVVKLMLTMMIPMLHNPSNYDDFSKMQNRVNELNDLIMKASSPKELHAVPDA